MHTCMWANCTYFNFLCDFLQQGDKFEFLCRCSFLEIYNEQVYDLLDQASTTGLHLRENIKKGVFVDGLIEQVVNNPADAYSVSLVKIELLAYPIPSAQEKVDLYWTRPWPQGCTWEREYQERCLMWMDSLNRWWITQPMHTGLHFRENIKESVL